MRKPTVKQIDEFLKESNAIERVYDEDSLSQARRAWSYAYRNRERIDLKYLLDIHKILLINLEPAIAGKLRDCDVWIGHQHKVFISEALLKTDLKKVFKKMNNERKGLSGQKKEELTKTVHIQFEGIHPFADGNGRTGRILYNIHRLNLNIPIHIIHEGDEQWEYYRWFNSNL